MLKTDTKEKLKTTYGLDVDKLIEAIKADAEVDFAVADDVTVLKNTDLETRDSNNKSAGKSEGITEGEKKGRELAAKAFRKKFNLADSVGNDVDKVVEAVHEQVGKGDAGLKEQIQLLQKDKETLNTQLTEEKAKARSSAFDAELISYFPVNRNKDLSDAERLALVKMNLKFEEVDGKTVAKKDGEIMRDKATQSPLAIKDAIGGLFTDKKWITKEGDGGRGGGDNPPGGNGSGIKTMSKFKEKWKAENPGKDENGPEFQNAVAAHAKDDKEFDYYN